MESPARIAPVPAARALTAQLPVHTGKGERDGERENRAFPKPMKCNCEHSSHGNSRIQGKKRKCKSDYQEGDEQGGKN